MTPPLRLVCGLIALFVSGAAFSARAQEIGRVEDVQSSGTAYHVYVEPGDATVQVGFVGPTTSGVYEVSTDTDLGRLLLLTGMLNLPPRQEGLRRNARVQLFRQEPNAARALAYEAPLETFLQEANRYPALRDGDLVVLEVTERQPFGWRDGLNLTAALAAVLFLVERVVWLVN